MAQDDPHWPEKYPLDSGDNRFLTIQVQNQTVRGVLTPEHSITTVTEALYKWARAQWPRATYFQVITLPVFMHDELTIVNTWDYAAAAAEED